MHSIGKSKDLWTDREFIDRYGEAAKKAPWPISLGRIKRQGYSAPMELYLIWCAPCRIALNEGFTVTPRAGYDRRLQCGYCHRRYEDRLLSRRAGDMLLNPLGHPWFALTLVALMAIIAYAVSRC